MRVKGGWEREATCFAQAAYFRAICLELEVQLCPKIPKVPRQTKATTLACHSVPRWSKGCPMGPKRIAKSGQENKKEVEGHPKEANKSENYAHINKYPQAPDPPPCRGRLVYRQLHDICGILSIFLRC